MVRAVGGLGLIHVGSVGHRGRQVNPEADGCSLHASLYVLYCRQQGGDGVLRSDSGYELPSPSIILCKFPASLYPTIAATR